MNCANHPDRERVAFCQNCGKPLCSECSRVVGQAVFCEPCLAARLAGNVPNPAAAGAGTYSWSGRSSGVDYTMSGSTPPPTLPGDPNPGLAALLGFIPGVGAFYNGQYAKGVVHLIVFAVLVSLTDSNGIFGLFITGWIFYMVFEAYQTARARRDGTPLPNPFGLNDLAERLGFGRSWPPGVPEPSPSAPPPVSAAPAYAPPPPTTSGMGTAAASPAAASYGPAPAANPYVAPPVQSSWGAPAETPPPAQPFPGYGYAPPFVPPPEPHDRLPIGAFILIGLGAFFLVANTGYFRGVPVQWLLPVLLIGFGVWLFVRRMTATGPTLTDDGSPGYSSRVYCALRGSIWLILVGILFFLDLTHVLGWGRSWPLFIVTAGALALLRRALYHPAYPVSYAYPGTGMPPRPADPASAAASASHGDSDTTASTGRS